MTWTLAEGIVDLITDYLKDNIAAKLNALDTEFETDGHDIELADPVDYFVGEHELDRIAETPAVFVLADDSDADNWRDTIIDATHELRIGIVVDDPDTEKLRRRLYRYGRALVELIVDAKTAGSLNGFLPRGNPRINYSPTLTDGSRFMGDVTLEWRFQLVEDRP